MSSERIAGRVAGAALVFGMIIQVLLWWSYPQEFLASDPWAYSSRAFGIYERLDPGNNSVFSHRIGITVPAAVIYKMFGVSIFTTNLWPLVSTLLVTLCVWLALPTVQSKVIGIVLCVLSVPLLRASTSLYPDMIAAAFMALSVLMLSYRQHVIARRTGPLLAAGSIFCRTSASSSLPFAIRSLASKASKRSLTNTCGHGRTLLSQDRRDGRGTRFVPWAHRRSRR